MGTTCEQELAGVGKPPPKPNWSQLWDKRTAWLGDPWGASGQSAAFPELQRGDEMELGESQSCRARRWRGRVCWHKCFAQMYVHEAIASMGHIPEAAAVQGKPPPLHFFFHSWCNSTAPANFSVCPTVGVWAGVAWPCATLCHHGLSLLGCSVPSRAVPGDTPSANPRCAGEVNPALCPCNSGFTRAAAGLSWSCCLGLFLPAL